MRKYLVHVLVCIAIVVSALIEFGLDHVGPKVSTRPEYADFAEAVEPYLDPDQPAVARRELDAVFVTAFEALLTYSFEPPEPTALVEAAIQGVHDLRPRHGAEPAARLLDAALAGMSHALDRHAGYVADMRYANIKAFSDGSFAGLAMEVTLEYGRVKVVRPFEDGPAQRAGIEAGDVIVRIDGAPVQGLPLNDAVARLRGPAGSKVALSLERPGQGPFEIILERARVTPKVVQHRVENRLGYLQVGSLNAEALGQIRAALADLERHLGEAQEGLILDLRGNAGGLLSEGVGAADLFLEHGTILAIRSRDRTQDRSFEATPGDAARGLPMAVLIDKTTGGVAEIVARALQGQGRARLLGQPSLGKVSVQTLYPLPGGRTLRITTARYLDASGEILPAKGIEPDVAIGLSGAATPACPAAAKAEDPVLACALALFSSGQIAEQAPRKSAKP